jgi:hypothetical protein
VEPRPAAARVDRSSATEGRLPTRNEPGRPRPRLRARSRSRSCAACCSGYRPAAARASP